MFGFFSIILLCNFIVAGNVAYVYGGPWSVDKNVENIFLDLGFNVDLVSCDFVLLTDFSEYDLIFVGEGWLKCAGEIPINEYPSVIMNGRNTQDLGLSGRRGISSVSSGTPLKDLVGDFFNSYTQTKYGRSYLSIYALKDYAQNGFTKIVEPYMGKSLDMGASVAYINSGTILTNGKTANEDICFFGLTKTRFWTEKSASLFEDCIEFVVGPSGGVHDIALGDLKITLDSEEFTDLNQGESYKILIDVFNVGDFTEDISFEGKILLGEEVVKTFSHKAVNNLESGESKNDKIKTVNFDMAKGDYEIIVEGIIEDEDYYPQNNLVFMNVKVV